MLTNVILLLIVLIIVEWGIIQAANKSEFDYVMLCAEEELQKEPSIEVMVEIGEHICRMEKMKYKDIKSLAEFEKRYTVKYKYLLQ